MSSQSPTHPSMPTPDDARLTQEHREHFGKWINSKAALIGKCPVCSSRKWALMEHFIHTPLFYPDGSVIFGGGPSYPFVGLMCTECGNTQFINAVTSGVLGNGPKTNQPE